ncbi:MAG TPA: methyl-accepting chemotaxis protein, partial [Thiothrix sp.]|nr:methyl-accepting chemotaxis protein [Thiothrix sp.]
DMNYRVTALDEGSAIIHQLESDYLTTLYKVQSGSLTWAEGLKRINTVEQTINNEHLPLYKQAREAYHRLENIEDTSQFAQLRGEQITSIFSKGRIYLEKEDRFQLELYLQNDLESDVKSLIDNLNAEISDDMLYSKAKLALATERARQYLVMDIILIIVGTLFIALLGLLIYRSIRQPINHLTHTVNKISAGDLDARVSLTGQNELAVLGNNFDKMVEERITTQAQIDRDYQHLNDSVFILLEAVADLSERNLTVRAKVTEDATGPLADAINQLAEDTGDVLKQVRDVATSVESASQKVNNHALSVNELAQLEQHEAQETLSQLQRSLQRLDTIAQSAQHTNRVADEASNTTQQAKDMVSLTQENMSHIQNTVQETGKRLKRLGERSQEISQIIDVINNLSERTTVLALNASMQATAAGEAGRGFSMVAEEIQHLSESSRESTQQISTLVRNIQQEANTTIATMEQTVEQVSKGAHLADDADQQMQATLDATNKLVAAVNQIAQSSAEQVLISQELQSRAERILSATQTTGKELLSLTGQTANMAAYGQRLVKSVNVFKLEA